MRVSVTTLAILRHPEEAYASGLETLDMALGASDLPVMLRQGKIRYRMLERVASADRLPIDDAKRATLVFGVTLQTTLASKGCMQTTGVKRRAMAGQAFLIGDTATRFVALRTAVGIVVSRVSFV